MEGCTIAPMPRPDLRLERARAERAGRFGPVLLLLLLACVTAITGCSIRKFAVGQVANSLTSGPDVFASDEDPELVGGAIPFGLKMMESLLQTVPKHEGLLLACCRGFTQYSYAYVQSTADSIESTDRDRAQAIRDRALKLYLRARGYGLRGLEKRHKGITQALSLKPDSAVARLTKKELPLVYWTAASWGAAISVGLDRPELTADLSVVKAMMGRALQLDEGYEKGAIHEAMIVLESVPEMMGGSPKRAREHFARAVELSNGEKAGPFVTLAQSVSVQTQNRAEFEKLLHQALEVDPDRHPEMRLENILSRRKARALLDREEQLFLDDTTHVEESPR
jgi:predicted anti-sigma-YlaC factor YlaD